MKQSLDAPNPSLHFIIIIAALGFSGACQLDPRDNIPMFATETSSFGTEALSPETTSGGLDSSGSFDSSTSSSPDSSTSSSPEGSSSSTTDAGCMPVDGSVSSEGHLELLSGVAYTSDFFYDGLVVALVPWPTAGCDTMDDSVMPWLDLDAQEAGTELVIIPLDGEELGGGDLWRVTGGGMAGEATLSSTVEVIQADELVGGTVSGCLEYTTGGKVMGTATFSVEYCGLES